jgi:hypothetical protein
MLIILIEIYYISQLLLVGSIEGTSQVYNNEDKNVGVRTTFLTKFTIQTINDTATFGKCLRKCTMNGDCESGEYDMILKKCRLLNRVPPDSDIIQKQNAITFYKGIQF